MSSRPILILGATTPVRARIQEVLVAAGYRVVIADCPADALRLAASSAPRAVVAPVDAAEAWRRLVHAVDEQSQRTLPVVMVGQDSVAVNGSAETPRPVVCREPGFGRRLLEEIQYAERTSRPAPAATGWRSVRELVVPLPARRPASL